MIKGKEKKIVEVQIIRKNGKVIIENDKKEWAFSGIDEQSALAALLFYTVRNRINLYSMYSDDFTLKITLEEDVK